MAALSMFWLIRPRFPEYTVFVILLCSASCVGVSCTPLSLPTTPVQRAFAYAAFCVLFGLSAPGRWDSADNLEASWMRDYMYILIHFRLCISFLVMWPVRASARQSHK